MKDHQDKTDLREETVKEVIEVIEETEVTDQAKVLDVTSVRNSVILPETVINQRVTEEDLRDLTDQIDLRDLTEEIEVTESVSSVSRVDIWLENVK